MCDLLNISSDEKEMKQRIEFPKLSGKTNNEINELIKQDKRYGKIVCRCETISEMEIVNAIHSPLKPRSLDAIKRRTRAGMGRCQGGFCQPYVAELIAKELGIPLEEVTKSGKNSRILRGKTK